MTGGDDEVQLAGLSGASFVAPGGKIDEAALRAAIDAATEQGLAEDSDEVASLRRVRFTLSRNLNKRLDKYLVDRIGFLSRTQLQRIIGGDEQAAGEVLVNGRRAKASTVLKLGDVVDVLVPPPPDNTIRPENIPLEILFEDRHLIVVNKAPDIIVHPARAHNSGTMVHALAWHVQHSGAALSSVGTEFARPGVVHRLDRDTSGVIVFAKTDEAHWKLGHQFEQRRVEKRYLALVHGLIEPASDVIDLPIGPHPSREKGYREKQVVRHDEQGRPALTIWRVREWYAGSGRAMPANSPTASTAPAPPTPAPGWSAPEASRRAAKGSPQLPPAKSPDRDFTLVELELRTGRTHQIRVHLSHHGYPIVGDDMYGGRPLAGTEAKAAPLIDRQALHAALLGFTHPITGEAMRFTAPLRGDMAGAIAHLRGRLSVASPGVPGTMIDLDAAIPRV